MEVIKRNSKKAKRQSISKNIQSQLEGTEEEQLTLFLSSIDKNPRTEKELELIYRYLLKLNQFVDLLKANSDHYLDLVFNIATVIKYEHQLKNYVLFRQGDMGDKFYIILKGSVSIFIAKPVIMKLSRDEYFQYLIHLRNNHEYSLLQDCIIKNSLVYWLNDTQVQTLLEKGEIKERNLLNNSIPENKKVLEKQIEDSTLNNRLEYVCPNDYPSNLKFNLKKLNENEERHSVEIYEYHKIVTLKQGFKFGDLAITSYNKKRVATIILEEDSYFGILNKPSYDQCLQSVGEKEKNNNLNFLLGNRIFKECKMGHFLKNFLNYFVKLKVLIHQKIITEDQETDRIYFIKQGEFQISMKKSLSEINQIIKSFGLEVRSEDRHIELIKENADFRKFMKEKRVIKISIINNEEILGLSNMLLNGKYIFDVECVSPNGELMIIERKFFENLLTRDKHVERNTKKYVDMKTSTMLERIIQIRKNKLDNFFSNQKYDLIINNIQETNTEKEANLDFISRNKSKNMSSTAISTIKFNRTENKFMTRTEPVKIQDLNDKIRRKSKNHTISSPKRLLKPSIDENDTIILKALDKIQPNTGNRVSNDNKKNTVDNNLLEMNLPNKSKFRNTKKVILKSKIDQIYSTFYNKGEKSIEESSVKKRNLVSVIDPLASDNFQRVFNTEEYFKINNKIRKVGIKKKFMNVNAKSTSEPIFIKKNHIFKINK